MTYVGAADFRLLAGPLGEAPTGDPIGLRSREAAEEFIEGDPPLARGAPAVNVGSRLP